jgi:hypothetical protein
VCIVCAYRAPSGDFPYFLKNIENTLNKLYRNSKNIIICGNVNINYLTNNNYKQQLDSLLASYGLYSTVTFSTRVCPNSSTAIDNIFINKCKNKNYIIYPWINGLPDHDGQFMTIYNVTHKVAKDQIHIHRIINESSILDFQINLSYELWDDVFIDSDVDTIFNTFLNTYLRISNSCFRISKSRTTYTNKLWVTAGIKKSCITKRELYIKTRNDNDPRLKTHYKEYCNILNKVILAAKRLYFY